METTYPRILGIDFGRQRIGVAVSDTLGFLAHPVGVLQASPKLFSELSELVVRYDIQIIIVGNPLSMKGEKSESSEEVTRFVEKLRQIFHKEIILLDERLTSVQAHQILRDSSTRKKRREKSSVDKIAAVLILQSYLDRMKNFEDTEER
ncbi:MAG: Holliday junction resolvase RuvX, partial [Ignavibacteriales bacterium]|nr:Holliday junction resolvase RuvX [Ignavibacteriales bacterium]